MGRLLAEKRYGGVARAALLGCHERAASMGEMRESVGTLATGLLHFLLMRAGIPSQRKVSYGGVDVDVVVPDLSTLEKSPEDAIVVCIQAGAAASLLARLAEARKVQPVRDNVWAVASEHVETQHRQFRVLPDGGSFCDIIDELARYGGSGLRILGSG